MSDVPQGHTGEPLVPISDDDVAYRAKRPHWTLTEALFLLSGYRPPGYESTRHMQDHFWFAYHEATASIEIGDLCRKIERAGEPCFIERPVRWLAWADSIGPEHIRVDERMRRALSQKAEPNPAPVSKGGATVTTVDAPQPDAETPETRREKQVRETEARRDRWYATSQEIKADNLLRTPLELAWAVATQEIKAGHTKANAETIKRRLNEDHKGWADLNPPKENGKN